MLGQDEGWEEDDLSTLQCWHLHFQFGPTPGHSDTSNWPSYETPPCALSKFTRTTKR